MYILKTLFFSAPGNHPNRCPSLSYTSRHPTSTRWVPMPKVEQPTPPGQRESPTRSKDPWPRGLGLHGECNRAFLEFGSKEFWSLPQKKLVHISRVVNFVPRFLFTVNGDTTPAETACLGTIRHTRSTFRKGGDRGDTQDGTKECSNGIRQIGLIFCMFCSGGKQPWVFPWRTPEIGWKYLEIWGTNIWYRDILINMYVYIYIRIYI